MYLRHAVYGHVKHQQGRCDRMVVGFVTTCAISTYITTKVVSLNPTRGGIYLIQHYVIKVCQWWFFLGTPVSSTNIFKTDRLDITEILFKVVLNKIIHLHQLWLMFYYHKNIYNKVGKRILDIVNSTQYRATVIIYLILNIFISHLYLEAIQNYSDNLLWLHETFAKIILYNKRFNYLNIVTLFCW
jgi:hypothetical protein